MPHTFCALVARFGIGAAVLCTLAACNSNGPTAAAVPGATSNFTSATGGFTTRNNGNTGTSGTTTAGSATVVWTAPSKNADGSALTNLAGFHVYYGTDANVLSAVVDVPRAGTISTVVRNLKSGTYYFAVSAYTNDGTESELSAVVSKQVG